VAEKDYYKTLEVAQNASPEDIRKAYRRLAKKYHPDRNKGSEAAEDKFKEVSEAYAVLGNAQKRKTYDQLREAGMRGGYSGFEDIFSGAKGGSRAGRAGPGAGWKFEDLGDMGDLFERIYGGARGAGPEFEARQAGRNLHSSVSVSFEMAARGGKVSVRIPRQETCKRCAGSGAAPGAGAEVCPQCGGSGKIARGSGGFSFARPCPLCFGRGKVIQKPCAACRGTGTVEALSDVEVKIPRGIEDGRKLRLAGLGETGAGGGRPGDLILEVRVQSHPVFRRRGLDVESPVTVDMVGAALGTEVDVKTMDGTVSVKVPRGAQPGQKLRLKGRGLQGPDSRRGDHFAVLRVRIPKKLTRKQEELLREFGRHGAASRK